MQETETDTDSETRREPGDNKSRDTWARNADEGTEARERRRGDGDEWRDEWLQLGERPHGVLQKERKLVSQNA